MIRMTENNGGELQCLSVQQPTGSSDRSWITQAEPCKKNKNSKKITRLPLKWPETNYRSCSVQLSSRHLGGDYVIPVCWDEISPCPAGTDLTLRLHVEIKFRPGKAGQFSTCHLFRFICHFANVNIAKSLRTPSLQNTFGGCFYIIIKFYKTFVNFFLTDWRHILRKNTIEIYSIYWNVLLWIFF